MSSMAKDFLRKSRNTLLGSVINSIELLDKRIDAVHQEIQATQLKINHNHLLILDEMNRRMKNSGTIQLSETEILTKIFSGLKMYLDPRDVAVVPHLALDSIWEHRITAAWLAAVKPNDIVLDVGANFGYFGALAAQLTDKKNSKVVMFEANPHLLPYLKKTLAVNWLNEQSVIENLAVSDKAGTVTLNLLEDYIGSSSIQTAEQLDTYMHGKMYLKTKEKIKVKAVSLDDYCKAHGIGQVDLIKMDIEGYEEVAYQGMRNIVKASPNLTFFIEFTKDGYQDPRGFYNQLLEDFGHVYVISDDGYIRKPKKSTYETIIGDTDDWVMPIFSKNPKLHNR